MLVAAAVPLLAAGTAVAQPVQKPGPEEELMMFFYKDPRPERLVGFIERATVEPTSDWGTYPPLAGFFAVIFRAHPQRIEQLLPARLGPQRAATIAAALRLSGEQAAAAKLRPRLGQAGRDEKLTAEFASLPQRVEDLQIRTPTHLDILWGASFASGDGRFARMVLGFIAQTANRSEPVAVDVAKTALAFMGGPKDILGELRGRYGNDAAAQIIVAGVALWGTQANARQHAFIDQTVAAYINDNAGTHAAKALSALRPRSR